MKRAVHSTNITPRSWSRGTAPPRSPSTDGRQIGATLDRNGLRPARYLVTSDDRIVMASEMGVLKIPEEQIVTKWRLQPGKMLLVDLEQGRLIPDDEIKAQLAKSHPYREWLDRTQIVLEELPDAPTKGMRSNLPLLDRQQAFGYSQEDITNLMTPMASTGEEANGSMGNDTPISALSDKRSRRCRTSRSRCSLISSRISRRSPIRRSIRSAKNWS